VPDEGPAANPMAASDGSRVSIQTDADIVTARQMGRALAAQLGFASSVSTVVSMAISELARNIVRYAKRGEIVLKPTNSNGRISIEIVAHDDGPGIANITQAMQDGFSTSGGLGLGLPGVKRLMDEFEIVSEVGRGTTVKIRKWKT
jgi:serine/threonine-protein kinase RsbT